MELKLDSEYFMQQALKLAIQAFDEGEVPIGAVVVSQNKIIGKGYNQVQKLNDPTAHAEMLAITAAANYLGAKYLTDCDLYVTVEPCIMCFGAIQWARLAHFYFGCSEPRSGFSNNLLPQEKTYFTQGILADQAAELMQAFFRSRR